MSFTSWRFSTSRTISYQAAFAISTPSISIQTPDSHALHDPATVLRNRGTPGEPNAATAHQQRQPIARTVPAGTGAAPGRQAGRGGIDLSGAFTAQSAPCGRVAFSRADRAAD